MVSILLSGDRHRSDIWKIERPRGYPLYEFVSAKVTNQHTHKTFDKRRLVLQRRETFGAASILI